MSKFGQGGGGAPLRDQFGNLIASRKPGDVTAVKPSIGVQEMKQLQKEQYQRELRDQMEQQKIKKEQEKKRIMREEMD